MACKPCVKQGFKSKLLTNFLQALGGRTLFVASVAGDDELIFHAVFPSHEFRHRYLIAIRFQVQAAQYIGNLAPKLARM